MVPCDPETEEEICWEILDSLKECLQHRWGSALPEEEPRQSLISKRTCRTTAQAEFHGRAQDTYDNFQNRWQESCEKALRVAQDAHHQALVAAALLKGHIKRLGHSVSHGWSSSQHPSGSCQHSCSRGCTRSCKRCPLASEQGQVPSVADHTVDPAKKWAPSPSPLRLRRQVTFEESSPRRDTEVKQAPPPNSGGR